jgi:ABC-type transport system involved in multi-copper enzyme maturation permease subunit
VNLTLITTLWRQRLASPVRLAIVAVLTGMPLLGVAFMPGAGLTLLGAGQGLVLALGAGLIGQDVSSGVLHLLCARPVRRPEYVVSRWLGVAFAASAISLLQLGIACALMAARGAAPTPQDALMFGAGRIFESFGIAAVLAFLSSLAGGIADLGFYLIASLVGGVIQTMGQMKNWLWVERAGAEFGAWLNPSIDLARLVSASPMPWSPIFAYAATVALCLALAILVVNRKELSYASG